MTNNADAQIAREWASKALDNDLLNELPIEGYRAAARHILATTTPPTMADMSPEEREACQWMQADVKLLNGGSATCVIANPRIPGAKVRVWAPHGGSDDIEEGRVTPLPDLPRLEWPVSEPVTESTPEPEPQTTPDHPAVLTTEVDYRNAPAGTVVAAEGEEAWTKNRDGLWETYDIITGYNDYLMAEDGARCVLRWGETL